jgi:hypothetical protein
MAASHTNGGSNTEHLAAAWPEGSREVALIQLDKILNSAHFRSSKRCSMFLRYVVEHASNHNLECLKERTLGVEVFERAPHYDTNQDPVVRIAAGEVRKRLAQYYQEPGREYEPRITLPAGSYVPAIHTMNPRIEPDLPVVEEQKMEPASPQKVRRYGVWAGVAGLAALAVCAFLVLPRFRETALDRFWAPVLASDGPVLVCMGQPKMYFFRTGTQAELDRWFATNTDGRVPPQIIESVPLSEFVPAWNRAISISDAAVFARLSGLFGRAGKEALLRGGRSVSLSDLRGRPVVLIGAFNNDWTLSLAGELRYFFDVEGRGGGQLVRDRQNPGKVDWVVRNSWPDLKIPIDYAIVSRVRNPITEQLVVTAAGITSFGTEAAGEFLTNPSYFAGALRNVPGDWHRKNIQVVLSAQVMSGTAGPPKVIAVHVW